MSSGSVAHAVREYLPSIQEELNSLGGQPSSSEFIGVGSRGQDVYRVHFPHGDAEWRIRLAGDGALEWMEHHPLKDATRVSLASTGWSLATANSLQSAE